MTSYQSVSHRADDNLVQSCKVELQTSQASQHKYVLMVEVQLHAFLASVPGGGKWKTRSPG
jgi:hypothetical protein